jgi:hypothetical protein
LAAVINYKGLRVSNQHCVFVYFFKASSTSVRFSVRIFGRITNGTGNQAVVVFGATLCAVSLQRLCYNIIGLLGPR